MFHHERRVGTVDCIVAQPRQIGEVAPDDRAGLTRDRQECLIEITPDHRDPGLGEGPHRLALATAKIEVGMSRPGIEDLDE